MSHGRPTSTSRQDSVTRRWAVGDGRRAANALTPPRPPPRLGGPMTPLDDLGPDFPAVLARVSSAVEERLGALWAERLASLQRYGAEVTAMASAARDLTLRGGKRDRAALLAAAYAGVAPAAPIEPALRAGVALELLQTYLLIQNDWMDRDDTRLGGASV